ncbi:MAG: hypothetical protein ACOZNI_19335 [Myxococcota bacterium]
MLLLPVLFSTASAGERVFAHSYGYGTVPKGGVEVEHYATVFAKPGDRNFWEQQIELEYGVTDRLEAGLYVVGTQWDDEALTFKKYKGRLRYRLGSEGVGPVDTNLYLEYIGTPTFDAHGVEAKLIFAKSVGRFTSALNLEYKVEFEAGEVVHEIEPTVGAGYKVVDWAYVGAEGRFEEYFLPSGLKGPFAWAGPSVHLMGEGGKIWWTLAVILPLTEHTTTYGGPIGRSLIAVNL